LQKEGAGCTASPFCFIPKSKTQRPNNFQLKQSAMDKNQPSDDEQNRENELLQYVAEYEAMQAAGEVRFWQLDPLLDIIDYYDDEMRTEDALQAAEFACQQYPYNAMPYIRQSHFLLELNRLDEAHEALDKAAIYDPSNDEIMLFRAEILVRQGVFEPALELLDTLRQRTNLDDEDISNIALVEAFLWEAKGDHGAAFDNLYTVLQKDSRSEVASVRMRIVMEQLDELAHVIPLLQKITDQDPYSAPAWLLLAYALGRENRTEEAIEAYELALVAQDDFEYGYYEYIDFLFNNRLFAQARAILHEASNAVVFENDAFPLFRMGECWQAEGELVQAMNYYKRALEIDHLDGFVYFQMGNLYVEFNLFVEASEAFATAHQLNDQQPYYLLALAQAKGKIGKTTDANRHFAAALHLHPDNVELWAGYLAFLLETNSFDAAAELLDMMESHDLDSVFLAYARAAISLCRKQLKLGYEQLTFALQLDSSRYDILFLLVPDLEKNDTVWQYINGFLTANDI
jgi:tetratricopeptide (TPR) repeat protein